MSEQTTWHEDLADRVAALSGDEGVAALAKQLRRDEMRRAFADVAARATADALADTLAVVGAEVGPRLADLRQRVADLEAGAVAAEQPAEQLPDWEAAFVRDADGLVKTIELRADGRPGVKGHVERLPSRLIERVIFQRAAPQYEMG